MKTLISASWSLLIPLAGPGCVTAGETAARLEGSVGQPLIYGADDRREASMGLASAMVALLERGAIHTATDGGTIQTMTDGGAWQSFEGVHRLCPDERFAAQPAISSCTGVLIAPDLVVTAAHCLERVGHCSDYLYVRGYSIVGDGGTVATESMTALKCDRVLAVEHTSILDERQLDFAIVQLEQPAEPFTALNIRRQRAGARERVITIGTSGGLPLKATTGEVSRWRDENDYFDFTGDLYVGGSGSGVFDAEDALLGIHVRGGVDFEFTPAGCWRSRTVADDGTQGSEQANAMAPIIDTLCALKPESSVCDAEAAEPAPTDSETDDPKATDPFPTRGRGQRARPIAPRVFEPAPAPEPVDASQENRDDGGQESTMHPEASNSRRSGGCATARMTGPSGSSNDGTWSTTLLLACVTLVRRRCGTRAHRDRK